LESQVLGERKLPQSFGLNVDQIVKLQELSKETGKSMSELVREAVEVYFQQRGI
jgi:predicted DNA-binding protein